MAEIKNKILSSLFVLLTVLATFVLVLMVAGKAMQLKSFKKILRLGVYIVAAYTLIWLWYFLKKTNRPVSLGTDVCFDSWCATIDSVNRQPSASGDSIVITLSVRIANHPPGTTGKPTDPRILLFDGEGHHWRAVATEGVPFDSRLAVNEIKETKLVYRLPGMAKHVKALVEEGPWVLTLIFPQDQDVFDIL
jgi:hypothetical protein